jgi:hypothetical protein
MIISHLKYKSFTTGRYDKNRVPGITLQLLSEHDMCPYHTHFNVDLNRKRKSGKYRKGDPLPGNRFSVTPNHGFYKFWIKTGLAIPPRLSAFNDYMGKLKQFTFIGEIKKNNRLISSSLAVMPIDFSNNKLTTNQQLPNNLPTKYSNNHFAQNMETSNLDEFFSTCENCHDISKQVTTLYDNNQSQLLTPIKQDKYLSEEQSFIDEIEKYF